MAEKGSRGGICHAIHQYANANDKYMKNYEIMIRKKRHILNIGTSIICMVAQCHKSC